MSSHYNTTNESGDLLDQFEAKAQSQEDLILDYFWSQNKWDLPAACITPSEVQKATLPSAPLTSVRRAMCNLTKAGYLEKTDRKFKGPYGRPQHAWRLKQ